MSGITYRRHAEHRKHQKQEEITMKQTLSMITSLTALTILVGCDGPSLDINRSDTAPTMMDKGIVYILPGIQGVDSHYKNIRQGLRGSGLKCAINIHPWGCV